MYPLASSVKFLPASTEPRLVEALSDEISVEPNPNPFRPELMAQLEAMIANTELFTKRGYDNSSD